MFDFLKKKKAVPFDQLLDSVKEPLMAKNEAAVASLLDEIVARRAENPQKAEAILGWAILIGCEFRLSCIGKYVNWFIQTYPKSISPVAVEMAIFLAETDKPEEGTQCARDYLRVVRDAGHFSRLPQMPIAQRGTSKAFLPLTAVYTHLGARSHSKRILNHAKSLPVVPDYIQHCDGEIARLDDELGNPRNAAIDGKWEVFFNSGANATELIAHCEAHRCPLFARRVELIENNFRFKPGYSVNEEEFYQLLMVYQEDGKEAFVLM